MSFRFCPLCAAGLVEVSTGPDAGRPACPTGHFVHYENPALTTVAFVRDDTGRYLALQRAHQPFVGAWDMPGGFVELGETPAECVLREIAEETALEVEIDRILGAYASRYGDGGKHTVDIAFACRLSGGRVVLSDEKSAYAWHSLENFPAPAFAGERAALADLRRMSA